MGGSYPIFVLAPAFALGFAARFFGNRLAFARGAWGMPWGARVTSWFLFAAAAFLMWSAGSLLAVAGFAAFLVFDIAGGLVKRDAQPKKERKKRNLRPMWTGAVIAAYLGLTAAFYFLVGQFVMHGVLITWTLLAFGFALLLRLSLAGPKAGEAWLRAPADHKRHERREREVVDPQRARAEAALASFRASGDATLFLTVIREAATSADIADAEREALEKRILASFARVGTRRDQDLVAALDEVEKALALRARHVPVTKEGSL